MMSFGRMEKLMYACRINLYWIDKETGEFIDLREAEVVGIRDDEITLYDSKQKLYWSYDIDTLEAKLDMLTDLHCKELKEAFRKLKAE